ncbi:DMT family transporter [Leucobacter ruminantium]|uniref:DMT family transporter n=1 Tax=Leucobacter ruminantium TaxID=1289170 RepID=A0A939RXS0_9MICO|nr:DMT family transporter [Leucobacter ruminantium]MBO1804141.1 DMT family transporter [Leucobacter ruminantium]
MGAPGEPLERASRIDRALLVLVTAVWGVNFVSARFGLDATTPLGFRVLTFGGGAAIVAVVAACSRTNLRLPRTRDYLHLLVAGVFSITGFGLLAALAVLSGGVGRTSIIVYTMPLWVVLFGRLMLGERIGGRRLTAVALGAAGLAVLLVPLLVEGESAGTPAALGAALSWAIGTVYLKRAGVDAPPIALTVWQLVAGTAVLGLAALFTRDPVFTAVPGPASWAGIVYTAVAGTAVAYLIWFRVVQRLPASTAGMGTLLVPVFGIAAAAILLGERPTLPDLAGSALILAAGLLALAPSRTEPDGGAQGTNLKR